MKHNRILIGLILFTLASCKKELNSGNHTIIPVPVVDSASNRPPVAKAGPDLRISLPVNSVTLDGSNSFDPDNNVKNYYWRIIAGSNSFSTDVAPFLPRIQVRNLQCQVYQYELTVKDFFGLESKDTVKVTVDPTLCVEGRPEINAQLIPVGILSRARGSMVVASAGNKMVFAGDGTTRADIYDMITNTWSTAELSNARSGIAAVSNGSKIFFAGGGYYDGNNDDWAAVSTVDIYDVISNSWSVTSLSEPRYNLSAAAVGNKVFFAGGYEWGLRKTVDIYDITTNSWSVSQLSEARESISAVTVNNKIHFAGGQNDVGPSSRIDIYDNATNSWSISALNKPGINMAAVASGNKIFWAGGFQNNNVSPVCNVEIKDVNTHSSSTASLFMPGVWNATYGSNAVIKNNKIVFVRLRAGNFGSHYSDKFDIYDITSDSWSIGVLPHLIAGASIISVNNIIYIAGGSVDDVFSNEVWKLEF